MPKGIPNKKNKGADYSVSISASISQKKLLKKLEKSIVASIKNKNSNLPIDHLSVSINSGTKAKNTKAWGTVVYSIVAAAAVFALSYLYLNPRQQPQIKVIPVVDTSTAITPKITPTISPVVARPIDKKSNIQVLNATGSRNIALNFKKVLLENRFESVTVGNSSVRIDPVTIEYFPGFQSEAEYLRDNFLGLSDASLRENANLSGTNDILITLGASYLQ